MQRDQTVFDTVSCVARANSDVGNVSFADLYASQCMNRDRIPDSRWTD